MRPSARPKSTSARHSASRLVTVATCYSATRRALRCSRLPCGRTSERCTLPMRLRTGFDLSAPGRLAVGPRAQATTKSTAPRTWGVQVVHELDPHPLNRGYASEARVRLATGDFAEFSFHALGGIEVLLWL